MSVFKLILLILMVSCSSVYQSGKATWYKKDQHGEKTASGQVYNRYLMTAAHKELPFGTRVQVINEDNGKDVVVRINDRINDDKRVIDLSTKAARKLGLKNTEEAEVSLRIVK